MEAAPILLFTYKRLDTLKTTIDALKDNDLASDSELYVFSDAAKHIVDEPIINEVRSFIHSIKGFRKVTVIESDRNKGLATSIIDGVNFVLNSFDRVIVLEDDLSTTQNFLSFMNGALNQYEDINQVFSISGYSFNLGYEASTLEDAYFLNRGWSWGWATWKSRWQSVDWEVKDYPSFIQDSKAQKRFAKGGSDLNDMLAKQMTGKLDSWAIRWFYHQFKVEGLTLYPVYSKVYNNGFDEFATHTNGSGKRYLPLLDKNKTFDIQKLPKIVGISKYYQSKFNFKMGIWSRIASKVGTVVKKLIKNNNCF